jgi:uncharacterized membrane protein YkvA (DUF1232 family)
MKWSKKKEEIKTESLAIYLAYKDNKLPWYSKILAIFLIVYVFSPIDLIPDFIPILGYIDDLIILPLGVGLVNATIPDKVLDKYRLQAKQQIKSNKQPEVWGGSIIIMVIFLILALVIVGKVIGLSISQ